MQCVALTNVRFPIRFVSQNRMFRGPPSCAQQRVASKLWRRRTSRTISRLSTILRRLYPTCAPCPAKISMSDRAAPVCRGSARARSNQDTTGLLERLRRDIDSVEPLRQRNARALGKFRPRKVQPPLGLAQDVRHIIFQRNKSRPSRVAVDPPMSMDRPPGQRIPRLFSLSSGRPNATLKLSSSWSESW